MSLIFNLIKGIIYPLCELLPLSGTGAEQLLKGMSITVIGQDSGSWYVVFGILGALASLILVMKDEIKSIILTLRKSIKKEEYEKEYLIYAAGLIPALFWAGLRILFGFVYENSLLLVLGFSVSVLFTFFAGKNNAEERNFESITLTDGILSGVFRLLSVVPGMSGTAGIVFSSATSGFPQEFTYRLSVISCIPVLIGEAVISIIPALSIPLGIVDVAGCILTLSGAFAAAYFSTLLLKKLIASKKFKVFSAILAAAAVLSLILWMRG